MKNIKSHFWYTKSQRNGILFLLVLILIFQLIYFFIGETPNDVVDISSNEIIAFEKEIDSLKKIELEKRKPKIFPFNPNFISDYKGYRLGMTTEEIDRLHEFRKHNKYVNSAKEFQQVTKVSDSLLKKIAPYFKFPDWVRNSKLKKQHKITAKIDKTRLPQITDINLATIKDFEAVLGENSELAERIIKYRSKLKGFTFPNQLYEVWGLEKNIATQLLTIFKVKNSPNIKKLNINTAKFKEVLKIPYIDYELCKRIFEYRDEVAELQDISELRNIKDFPENIYARIVLYLSAE